MKRAWLSEYLTDNGARQIEAAVGRVEKVTLGEVVPVVVGRSTTPLRLKYFLWILFSVFFVGLVEMSFSFFWWEPLWWQRLPSVAGAFVVSYLVANTTARFSILERLAIGSQALQQSVWRRAELEFYRSKINETDSHAGVLIFVSIFERKAVVLADSRIASRVGQHEWQTVVDILIENLKKKDLARGFDLAIDRAGQILAQHFAGEKNKHNEIENRLIVHDY